jgi:predicted nucleotide-binding protein (sugar kinase/HSP70/actin superfamily)
MFADGVKIEFNGDGEWKDVDCKFGAVPAAIIPKKIASYVAKNYPDAKIIKIDRDRRDYEVSLSNRLELTFDMKFNLVEIDD